VPDSELALGCPGFAWRRGAIGAANTAPMSAVAGVRAAPATARSRQGAAGRDDVLR